MCCHEAIAGRNASDVASAYIKLITACGVPKHILIWADNCNTQNKNWTLFTALIQCVNTWGPETITVKFLEKGHTFMAADNVRGDIGKSTKKRQVIATFDDFVDIL